MLYARKHPTKAHATFAIGSLLLGFLIFARFNAIQSAWPIFNPPQTAITQALNDLQRNNGGTLVIEGLFGATANGLGYRSLTHVTATPQLAFWQDHFPNLSDSDLNNVFNRYSHIWLTLNTEPRVIQSDVVSVPAADFIAKSDVHYLKTPHRTNDKSGAIDSAELDGNSLVLSGWAPWSGGMETQALEVFMNPEPAGAAKRLVVLRPDVAKALGRDELMMSGFKLRIPFHEKLSHKPEICIYFHKTQGEPPVLLQNPPGLPYCQTSESMKQ